LSRGALAALAALVIALSCAGSAPASNHESRLTWAVHITLAARWLDPGETESAITPFLVLYALHDALVKPMPGGVMTPSLAESWTASADGRTYDFLLRPNLRFHNGDPLTAEDVKFSFERYKGGARVIEGRVREVQVVDTACALHSEGAWPDHDVLGRPPPAPDGWCRNQAWEAYKKPGRGGALSLRDFTRVSSWCGGWAAAAEAPHGQAPGAESMPEETTRAAARRQVDLAYWFTGSVADEMKRTPGLRLVPVRTNTVFFLDFVEQWDPKSPWADQRVRLAASLAVDRAAINQAEFLGFGGLTGTVVPRAMEFAAPIEAHKHDPKRARELLAEAGHPNGFDAGELAAAPPYTTAGEAIVNDLAKVGIRMRPRSMERAAYLSAWRDKKLKGCSAASVRRAMRPRVSRRS
jgi:peptide/nickel transport system substrate-binding protein